MSDLIDRQAAIDEVARWTGYLDEDMITRIQIGLKRLPSAQPERLKDDDFETIRIHLSAHKELLCNQNRWKEAEEYQRIIDRFMNFASAQPERKKGKWICWLEKIENDTFEYVWKPPRCKCSECGTEYDWHTAKFINYCSYCGAELKGEEHE